VDDEDDDGGGSCDGGWGSVEGGGGSPFGGGGSPGPDVFGVFSAGAPPRADPGGCIELGVDGCCAEALPSGVGGPYGPEPGADGSFGVG
jgi:hypothetical protein